MSKAAKITGIITIIALIIITVVNFIAGILIISRGDIMDALEKMIEDEVSIIKSNTWAKILAVLIYIIIVLIDLMYLVYLIIFISMFNKRQESYDTKLFHYIALFLSLFSFFGMVVIFNKKTLILGIIYLFFYVVSVIIHDIYSIICIRDVNEEIECAKEADMEEI